MLFILASLMFCLVIVSLTESVVLKSLIVIIEMCILLVSLCFKALLFSGFVVMCVYTYNLYLGFYIVT